MPDFLKIFWQKDLAEIRENKIRFGAILILLIAAVIFALADSTSADTEIPLEQTAAPQAVEIPADKQIQPVQTAALPAASQNLKPVLGASSGELCVGDPFTAPVIEIPEPPPAPVAAPAVEIPVEMPEIPVAQIEFKPAEKFALNGTAINDGSKTAIIHKITGGDKAEIFIVSLGDTLGARRVTDITVDFVQLDDGSKISFSP